MKKKFIVTLLGIMFLFSSVAPITANAQSGGGADVCTYYYNNGFKTQASCNKWLAARTQLESPAWTKKISTCMVKRAITGSAPLFAKELRKSPKAIAITYGLGVIACLF